MDSRTSQESLGLASQPALCSYEDKVVSDPTTARVVLMFLRDFVDQRTTHAQNPQGFYCPMTKCELSFNEPLQLIQHLLSCSELGKGEFECWKCCGWHRFPTSEKEWAEWSGWKSTTVGFQRKRSLGSKMKETLTETLALRRRNSGRKISVSSTSCPSDANQIPTSVMAATAAMVSPSTLPGSTAAVDPNIGGVIPSAQQQIQYRPPADFSEWSQLLGMAQNQLLSPRTVQQLRSTFMVDQDMAPAFPSTSGNEAGINVSSRTSATPGYVCAFNADCYVTSQHHHHQAEPSHELGIKSESGTTISTLAEACYCSQYDGNSTTSIALDDASGTMVWSTDIDSSDISNISSTRPSTTFDQGPSLPPSTNPSQGSLFANQSLSPFSQEAAHLIAAGMGGGTVGLASDISALRSPNAAAGGLLMDGRGNTTTGFPSTSPMRSDDRLTVTGSFASTPASGDLERSDKAIEERHNWYHGQHLNESVILASTDENIDRISPAALTPATAVNAVQQSSMDVDMENGTQQPNHQAAVFLQASVPLAQELLHAQIQQPHELQQHYQQPVPVTLQETVARMNTGLYSTSTSLPTATPIYDFTGDNLVQSESRPTSHHQDLTSSSRTSLQPPKTPASTIDDDVDPEDLVCPECQWKPRGVRENLRGYLRKHRNVHKGLRLSCDTPGCKKSFSRLDNLKTHRRDKHGIDDTAPASKAASTASIDSAGIMAGRQIATAGSGILPVKRAMTMQDYANKGLTDMMSVSNIPNPVVSTQPQHILQAAATIAQAQAQAQAQARQAQLAQAHLQAHAAQAHVHHAQAQATHVHAEPPRPDSKRQRESLDHGYRGVSGEHAALWPLMQI